MRRIPLAVFLLVVGAAACKEAATSPFDAADLRVSNGWGVAPPGTPPPPDADTQAVGYSGGSSYGLILNVRYFFNPPANTGWIKFDASEGTTEVDQNAQIRYSKGVFTGKGTIEANGIVIDLATVSQSSRFAACDAHGTPTATASATTSTQPVGCFDLVIGSGQNEVKFAENCPEDEAGVPLSSDPRKEVCAAQNPRGETLGDVR